MGLPGDRVSKSARFRKISCGPGNFFSVLCCVNIDRQRFSINIPAFVSDWGDTMKRVECFQEQDALIWQMLDCSERLAIIEIKVAVVKVMIFPDVFWPQHFRSTFPRRIPIAWF